MPLQSFNYFLVSYNNFLLLRKPVKFLKISEPPFFQIWKYMERDFSKRLANADVFIYE